jgi:hypothetical protein
LKGFIVKLAANRKNLKAHSRALLCNEYSTKRERDLIRECLAGFVRESGHVSHSRSAHLDRIGKLLGTYGTEGMLLNKDGGDESGTCSMQDVVLDVQYCNAGDSYAITVLYVNGKLCVGDWGSLVERLG